METDVFGTRPQFAQSAIGRAQCVLRARRGRCGASASWGFRGRDVAELGGR